MASIFRRLQPVAHLGATWGREEALVGLCMAPRSFWVEKELSSAQLIRAQKLFGSAVDIAEIDSSVAEIARPWVAAMANMSTHKMDPCLWVRWAYSSIPLLLRSELNAAFDQWFGAYAALGFLPTMQFKAAGEKKWRGPKFSQAGHKSRYGVPVYPFVTSRFESNLADQSWRTRLYLLDTPMIDAPSSSLKSEHSERVNKQDAQLPHQLLAVGKRRGKKITVAIYAALLDLSTNDRRIVRPDSDEVAGTTRIFCSRELWREDVESALVRGYPSVAKYKSGTIRTVISSLMECRRGTREHHRD